MARLTRAEQRAEVALQANFSIDDTVLVNGEIVTISKFFANGKVQVTNSNGHSVNVLTSQMERETTMQTPETTEAVEQAEAIEATEAVEQAEATEAVEATEQAEATEQPKKKEEKVVVDDEDYSLINVVQPGGEGYDLIKGYLETVPEGADVLPVRLAGGDTSVKTYVRVNPETGNLEFHLSWFGLEKPGVRAYIAKVDEAVHPVDFIEGLMAQKGSFYSLDEIELMASLYNDPEGSVVSSRNKKFKRMMSRIGFAKENSATWAAVFQAEADRIATERAKAEADKKAAAEAKAKEKAEAKAKAEADKKAEAAAEEKAEEQAASEIAVPENN